MCVVSIITQDLSFPSHNYTLEFEFEFRIHTSKIRRNRDLPTTTRVLLIGGIDLFLAMSLLTCLLDKHFPSQLPYIYQLAALAGFDH